VTEEESNKEMPSNTSPDPSREGKPAPAGESILPLVIIVVMLVLLGGGIWWVARRNNAAPAATGAATTSTAPAKSDPMIATVDGMDIHESEFSAAIELIPENMRAPLATPVGKKRLAEELIRMKLLAREAKKLKVDDDPMVKARIVVSEENILSNAAAEKMLQQSQSTSLQDLYNRNKSEFETAKTRQIMVAYQGGAVPARSGKPLSEAEARAKAEQIATKIRAGADFAQVAKAESDEPGVANSGGVIGDVTHGSLPPEVEKVLFSLPVNQVSGPVKSQYAFHIFQVTGKETRTFDQVKPALERGGGQQLRIKNMLDELRSKAKVTWSPTFLPAEVTATP
jgi:peptidyl-prolyl cis-trans isomerase C